MSETEYDWSRDPLVYTLDEQGNPVPSASMDLWSNGHEDDPRYNVGDDHVSGPLGEVYVSTKFLSLNMRYSAGAPLLWETMAFYVDDRPNSWDMPRTYGNDLVQLRHSSLAAAQKIHQETVAMAEMLVRTPEVTDYDTAYTFAQGFFYDRNEDDIPNNGPTTE